LRLSFNAPDTANPNVVNGSSVDLSSVTPLIARPFLFARQENSASNLPGVLRSSPDDQAVRALVAERLDYGNDRIA
jgi:hypothetical protein